MLGGGKRRKGEIEKVERRGREKREGREWKMARKKEKTRNFLTPPRSVPFLAIRPSRATGMYDRRPLWSGREK